MTAAPGGAVNSRQRTGGQRRLVVSIAALATGVVPVTLTAHFARQPEFAWLSAQRDRVIAAELGLFGVIIVETIASNSALAIGIGGVTGRVTDIRVMHTRLDLGNEIALIPSNVLMTQMIRRKPWTGEDDLE